MIQLLNMQISHEMKVMKNVLVEEIVLVVVVNVLLLNEEF